VLTISISIASGVDAFFSLLPLDWQPYKLATEVVLIVVLVLLNLRGMKEVIAVVAAIFLGFVLTHAYLIVYGILAQATVLPDLVPEVGRLTSDLSGQLGWTGRRRPPPARLFQGGGTYTGLEAVSNNVNVLAEPRVHTGIGHMLYMALSLAFTAGGSSSSTCCGVRARSRDRRSMRSRLGRSSELRVGDRRDSRALVVVLGSRRGCLFVAAKHRLPGRPRGARKHGRRFLGAAQFRYLSSRLVTKRDSVMGVASLVILLWTGGSVRR